MVILLCQKSKYIFGKCFLQLFEITASKNRSYDIQGQQFINYSLHRLWSPCPTVGHCNSAFHHPSDLRQVTPTKISGKLPATHSSANVYLVHSTKLVILKAKYYFFFFKKKKKKTFCGLQCYWFLWLGVTRDCLPPSPFWESNCMWKLRWMLVAYNVRYNVHVYNDWDTDSKNGTTKIIVMMKSGEFGQYCRLV